MPRLARQVRLRTAFQLWWRGHPEAALPALRELAPHDAGARWVLGLALAEAGASPEEPAQLLTATPAAPASFLGAALLWLGDAAEAVRAVERSSSSDPLTTALLGLARLELGETETAARTWRAAGSPAWRLCAARALAVLLEEADRREPEALRRRLAGDLREEPAPHPSRLHALGTSVLGWLEQVGPLLRRDRLACERVRILSLAERGRLQEALARARALRKARRDEVGPRELLATLLAAAGEDRSLLELGGEGPELTARSALALARLGRWEEALERLGGLPRPDLFCLHAAGCAEALAGRRDRAARCFLRLGGVDELALLDLLEREAGLFLRPTSNPPG